MRSWKGLSGSFAGLAILALALAGNGCSGDDTTGTGAGGSAGSDAGAKGGSAEAGPVAGNKGGSVDAAAPDATQDAAQDAVTQDVVTQDVLPDAVPGAGGSNVQPDAQGAGGSNVQPDAQGTGGATPTEAGAGGSTNAGGAVVNAGGTVVNAGGSDAGESGGSSAGGSNAGGSNAGGSNAGGSNAGGSNAGGSNVGGSNPGVGGADAGEPDGDAGETGGNDGGDASSAGGSNTGGSNTGGSNPGVGGTVDSGPDADAATISYLCTWDFDKFPDGGVSGGQNVTDVCGLTPSGTTTTTGGDGTLVTFNDGTAPGSTEPGCLEFVTDFGKEDAPTLAGAPRGSVRLRQFTAQSINWRVNHTLHAWVKVVVPGSTATIGLIAGDSAATPNFVRGPKKPIGELPTGTWVQLDFDVQDDAGAITGTTSRFGIEIVPQDISGSLWQNATVRLDNLWID